MAMVQRRRLFTRCPFDCSAFVSVLLKMCKVLFLSGAGPSGLAMGGRNPSKCGVLSGEWAGGLARGARGGVSSFKCSVSRPADFEVEQPSNQVTKKAGNGTSNIQHSTPK